MCVCVCECVCVCVCVCVEGEARTCAYRDAVSKRHAGKRSTCVPDVLHICRDIRVHVCVCVRVWS